MRKVLFLDRGGTLIEPPSAAGRRRRASPVAAWRDSRAAPDPQGRTSSSSSSRIKPVSAARAYPRERLRPSRPLHGGAVRDRRASSSPRRSLVRTGPSIGCGAASPRSASCGSFVNVRRSTAPLRRWSATATADLEFARNLGIAATRSAHPAPRTWAAIAHALVDRPRVAVVERHTRETDIRVAVDLDSEAEPRATDGPRLLRPHARAARQARRLRARRAAAAATCTSTSTTRSRTSRSRSARRCARRSATSAASSATASCCRWTRRTPRCRSISAAAHTSCSREGSRASVSASCRPSSCRTSSARSPRRSARRSTSACAARTRTTWSRSASKASRARCGKRSSRRGDDLPSTKGAL